MFVYVFAHHLFVLPFHKFPSHCFNAVLVCCVCIFCVTSRVEARLSVGFSSQLAEVFPWHIVWAHKCLNLVLYYMSISWSLALSLAIAVIVVHKCLIFA